MKVKATVAFDNEKHLILVDLDDETVTSIGLAFQHKCDVEDVLSYAENEYGECADSKIAKKIKENAEDIARDYRHAMGNDESWFYVLENTVESWLEDNEEV